MQQTISMRLIVLQPPQSQPPIPQHLPQPSSQHDSPSAISQTYCFVSIISKSFPTCNTSCRIIAYLASTILFPSLKLSKALQINQPLSQRYCSRSAYQSTVTYLTPTFLATISFWIFPPANPFGPKITCVKLLRQKLVTTLAPCRESLFFNSISDTKGPIYPFI
jgi:hypothetical protein